MVQGVESGLAVRFFTKKANETQYTAQEEEYDISPEDVVRNIPDPHMVLSGSRLFYTFYVW